MGRSKEMGKAVDQLTRDELRRELVRCRTLLQVCGTRAAKGLAKRLRLIEQRLEFEADSEAIPRE